MLGNNDFIAPRTPYCAAVYSPYLAAYIAHIPLHLNSHLCFRINFSYLTQTRTLTLTQPLLQNLWRTGYTRCPTSCKVRPI